MDGYDVGESKRVLVQGLTQIEARALEELAIADFVMTGLGGLADVDPLFSIVEAPAAVQVYVGDELAADLALPQEDAISPWIELFHGAMIGARRKSTLLGAADREEIYYAFFDAALSELDPYSRYAGKLQARANRETRNGFGGIGMRYLDGDLGLKVTGVQKNSPAAHAGLRVGDLITHVDGLSVAAQRRWTVRRLLRGPIGSESKFTVIGGKLGYANTLKVTRGLIVPQTVETEIADGVAVVKIHSFNQQTAQTVDAELKGIFEKQPSLTGVILDLRGDPGGLLDQAVTVSDLFIESGRIVSTRGRHPESVQRYQAFSGDIAAGRPVIVLVDSRSASAAEIVAAAIQDTGRGFVVGTSTYGKGTVQTVIRLPNDGEITLTWSRFHAPDGYAIQDLGVLPFVCTSGLAGPADEALQAWSTTGSQIARAKAEWRTVSLTDVTARSGLRSQCPAEVRPETSNDLEIAKNLLADTALYAQALGLTATTEAQQD